MALYSGRILVRKGLESDFDAEKLMPGEWALSTDKKIVRICVLAGVTIRMATYEAFEEDMGRVEEILRNCQNIQEAIDRINAEVSQKANAVAEYTEEAKQYRDEAESFRNEAESFKNQAGQIVGIGIATTEKAGIVKPDGETLEIDNDGTMRVIGGGGVSDYAELENKPTINGTELNGDKTLEELGIASAEELDKTTQKVDTIIEKADLGIKETASGENIHLTDSAESKVVEFALYGKAKQNITSGKNLIPISEYTTESSGETRKIMDMPLLKTGETYILSSKAKDGTLVNNSNCQLIFRDKDNNNVFVSDNTMWVNGKKVEVDLSSVTTFYIYTTSALAGKTIQFQLEKGTVATPWEEFSGGQASPSPDYPQDVFVSGESYNLLENTATSQTKGGVIFTVNENKSVTCNGTGQGTVVLDIKIDIPLENGQKYILTGCPNGGSSSTYELRIRKTDGTALVNDFGSGVEYIHTGDIVDCILVIRNSVIANNLTFYPMIRKASVKNCRYMPYGVGSVEVKSVGKNLLKNTATTRTVNGVIITVNEDGTVDISGTPTEFVAMTVNSSFKLPKKRLKFSGLESTKNITWDKLYCYGKKNETITAIDLTGNINKNFEIDLSGSEYEEVTHFELSIKRVSNGNECSGTFYPMIRLATDTDSTYEPYKETLSTIPTDGLAGIPVSSGGNYTDQSGQQWICDEIVKYADGSGEFVQRVGKEVFDGSADEGWSISKEGFFDITISDRKRTQNAICSHYVNERKWETFLTLNNAFLAPTNSNLLRFKNSSVDDVEAWIQNLKSNPITVLYELAEPIRTPLTAEQIAEIEKLSTFYPVTNISNDFDCGMRVKYLADSKNYIDNQLALQAQAREAEMMAMFMLLPEETQAAMIENDINNLLLESEV